MRILVIAPHPDDEVLGCGGVMARHVAEGHEVHVVVVGRGTPELYSDEMVATSRRELDAAHAVLGVSSVTYFDFPAPRLDTVPQHQLADRTGRVLQELKPEVVSLPHHGDIHSDHRQVHLATLVAARPLADCPVRRLLAYETLSETEWAPATADAAFLPTVFVDIEKYLPKKLEAMKCYQSKLVPPPHPRSLEAIETLARWRGGTAHLHAAEAFSQIREIIVEA